MENVMEMSFQSCYRFGSMIGGSDRKFPVIHLKNGEKITDIKVGEQNLTTWAYTENTSTDGETVGDCLRRHGVSISDVKKIVLTTVDTTGEGVVVQKQTWTME